MLARNNLFPPIALILFSIALMIASVRCSSGPTQPITAPSPEPSPLLLPKPPLMESGCCPQAWPGTKDGAKHTTRLTGYYPDSSALEGGFHSRYGDPLQTLQSFAVGKGRHVSVALDKNLGKVKRKICIPSLGEDVAFLVEDTGGAFTGKGWSRLDICVANEHESVKSAVNATVEIVECK